jgi:hypothetical protein
LSSEDARAAVRRSGVRTAAVLTETLSAPRPTISTASSGVEMPPPTVKGMERPVCNGGDPVAHGLAPFRRSGDVEEDEFVRSLFHIQGRERRRVSRIAEIDEIDALHHPAVLHVQAGDHSGCQHRRHRCSAVARSHSPS